jgi:hypothetical protein
MTWDAFDTENSLYVSSAHQEVTVQTQILASFLETTQDLVVPLAAVLVTLAGLWLGHNYGRQMALRGCPEFLSW